MLIGLLFLILIVLALVKVYSRLRCGYCKCSNHLIGKVAIVTEASAGIGYCTAKDLAERGARVIISSRNDVKGLRAKHKIIAATNNHDVHYYKLDLASFASVTNFADHVNKTQTRLDILVNNAQVFADDYTLTEDRLLTTMQCNYFGPFLLTKLLLPLLKKWTPSRIINVSSIAHRFAAINLENLNMNAITFNPVKAYSNSKLCCILMTMELSRRLKPYRVTVNCMCPGAVAGNLSTEGPWLQYMYNVLAQPLIMKDQWEGAQTIIYLAVSPEVSKVTGAYFVNCRRAKPSSESQDPAKARQLWEITEDIIKR